MTPTIREHMTHTPFTIERTQSLAEASELMAIKAIYHLPVVERGKLVGLLTERDIYWCEAHKSADPEVMSVGEAMEPEPFVVAPNDSLEAVVRQMGERRLGSALVVDDGKLEGVFTMIDALRILAVLLRTGKLARDD